MQKGNNNSNKENEQVREILENTHVKFLGKGTVELTHGINRCVRKVHQLPEYLRTEE